MGVHPGSRKVPSRLLNADLDWQTNGADPYLYQVSVGRSTWRLQVNDFSDGDAFSLFRDGDLTAEFDDRRRGWRPG
jgi:hypothetical protein